MYEGVKHYIGTDTKGNTKYEGKKKATIFIVA
jgi:hypothetical protein